MKSDYLRMLLQSKDKSAILDNIAQTSFDALAEIDFAANTLRVVSRMPGKYAMSMETGDFHEIFERALSRFVHPDDREAFRAQMQPETLRERLENAPTPGFLSGQMRFLREDGGWQWTEQVLIYGAQYGLPDGVAQLYLYDIQSAKELESRRAAPPEKSALRDELTGLYMDKAFFALAQERIPALQGEWCLIAIDIEHFKLYQDWNGHEKALRLLRRYGEILRDYAAGCDGLAGYHGQDDFCLLAPYDRAAIDALFEDMRKTLRELSGTVGFLPIFGICLIDGPDAQVMDVFNHAALTAESIKGNYRSRIQLYDAEMQRRSAREFFLLSDFQRALEEGEIIFYVQPQCRVSNRMVVGAESLARWRKRDGSFISPAEFVPLLERHGIVVHLDQYIWEQVCLWLRGMIDRGVRPVPVSVNVSRIDIFTVNVPEYLKSLVDRYGLPIEYLKIEITESAYAEDTALVGDTIRRLREMGFTVLLDDFGSGYSSLNMLRTLNVDVIKLDAQFLHFSLTEGRRGLNIVEAIVNMTKTLGTPVVIEGVESEEQVRFLADMGCRYMQGFYFYPPMTTDEYERLISDPARVDYRGFIFKANQQMHIREFIDSSVYSDVMLNNILGPVCFYSWKDDSVDILRFNQQFYEMVGLEPDVLEARRHHIENFFHPEDVPKFFETFRQALRDRINGAMGVFRVFKPNGSIFWISLHLYYIDEDPGGKKFYASAQDVTELQYINMDLPGGYYRCTVDQGYQFQYVSSSFQDIVGYTAEEIRARFDNKLINLVHPEDRNRLVIDSDAVAAGTMTDVRPYRLLNKDRGYVYVAEKGRLTDRFGAVCWQCVTIEITETMRLRNQMRLLAGYLSSSIVFVHLYDDHTLRYEVAVHGLEKELGMDRAAFERALNDGSFIRCFDIPAGLRSRDRYWLYRDDPSVMNATYTVHPPGCPPVRLRCRFDRVPIESGNVRCILAFSVE